MTRTYRCLPVIRTALALALPVLAAWAVPVHAGNPERGRDLAVRWCTSCHVVADDVPGGVIGPAFQGIVPTQGRSEAQLRGWLAAPHSPMPDFGLSAREINDLVAYILTLGES